MAELRMIRFGIAKENKYFRSVSTMWNSIIKCGLIWNSWLDTLITIETEHNNSPFYSWFYLFISSLSEFVGYGRKFN